MKNIKKVLALFVVIIVLLGVFFVVKKDFNYGLEYSKTTELKFMLGLVLDMNEVEGIVKEAFNNKWLKIQKIDYFNDSVNITVFEPTNGEIQVLIDKFNERYNQNNTMDSVSIVKTSDISIKEIIKPYVLPIIIILVLIAIYMGIRFRKSGVAKVALLPITLVLIVEAVFLAIYAIVRIPITLYTMPIMLFLAILTITMFAYKYEKNI